MGIDCRWLGMGCDGFYDEYSVEAPGQNGTYNYQFAKNRGNLVKKEVAKKSSNPECDKLLATLGMTFDDLKTSVADMEFRDGTSSGERMVQLFESAPPDIYERAVKQYESQTVSSYLATHTAAAVACAGCIFVYLDYNYFGGGDLSSSIATIMHEALHNYTGLTDERLQIKLHDAGYNIKVGDSSNNITSLMETTCR